MFATNLELTYEDWNNAYLVTSWRAVNLELTYKMVEFCGNCEMETKINLKYLKFIKYEQLEVIFYPGFA